MLDKIENYDEYQLPELNDAIRMIRKSWLDVITGTNVRCWNHIFNNSCQVGPSLNDGNRKDEKNEEFISVKEYLSKEETESTDEILSDEDLVDLVLNNDCDEEHLNLNVSETKNQYRPTLTFLVHLKVCIDYRKLNEVTITEKWPLPNIQDILDRLKDSVWFTVIDLKSGY
ncbi:unnamed protein product [Brachionus calyciflorus]|uniref:Uncharacterized protein n=1 Tax=Brachionus calyciflorus TaxID=104777 RepID=A0A813N0P5_9BILA|nr:unnamed protein product [Brachionus calyciflorus]